MIKVEGVVIRERVDLVDDGLEEQTGHVGVTVVRQSANGRQRGITHEYRRGIARHSRPWPGIQAVYDCDQNIQLESARGTAYGSVREPDSERPPRPGQVVPSLGERSEDRAARAPLQEQLADDPAHRCHITPGQGRSLASSASFRTRL